MTEISLQTTLLPGSRELLAVHAREAPQRDDLCGAFCGALALRAAGLARTPAGGEPIDQDAVALAAGSVVCRVADASILPRGEQSRRDYRLRLPFVDDPAVSGTTAAGVAGAVRELSAGHLEAIPLASPWSAQTLDGLFDLAATLARPVTLIANHATRYLWGTHPRADQLLTYLLDGEQAGPAPDWDVGHYACVIGRVRGAGGSLFCMADTYPSLGAGGVHVQPRERLAAAIERREGPAGGVIAIVDAHDAPSIRAGAAALGLIEGMWDNGTVAPADCVDATASPSASASASASATAAGGASPSGAAP